MRRAAIVEQNRYLVRRQRSFRAAADWLADRFARFDEVAAVALTGSVARPLWKEVPRFRQFRRERIEVWHECGDLDLVLWLSSLERLDDLRRARDSALRRADEAGRNFGLAGFQVDCFLFEPGSDRYLGRLCSFNQCPKGKPHCETPGCGAVPFLKQHEGFQLWPGLLQGSLLLYRRGEGRLARAADLPDVPEDG